MTYKLLKARLKAFCTREDGSIAIEAMIVLPAMFWAFLSVFSIYDTFRTYSINQKAAYTIGDAISRETAPLDDAYLDGMLGLFDYLSRGDGQSALRVSSLRWDADQDRFYRDWSRARGPITALSNNDVQGWTSRLPVMPHGERVVVVETWNQYEPPFATGLEERNIHNFVFTRPRFAPRVCWQQCNGL